MTRKSKILVRVGVGCWALTVASLISIAIMGVVTQTSAVAAAVGYADSLVLSDDGSVLGVVRPVGPIILQVPCGGTAISYAMTEGEALRLAGMLREAASP